MAGASQRGPTIRSFTMAICNNDEDSASRQPEIKGLIDELFVGLGHWGQVSVSGH
jgi:hypothetical protein